MCVCGECEVCVSVRGSVRGECEGVECEVCVSVREC